MPEVAHTYFEQWRKYMPHLKLPENPAEFQGLSPDDFHHFGSCFQERLTVGELDEEGHVSLYHHPTTQHKDQLYLNMYGTHLSCVISFQAYAKKYRCRLCERLFSQIYNLKKHSRVCCNMTRYVYPCDVYKSHRTIFQELEQFNINIEERLFNYFATYDFESVLEKIDEVSPSGKLNWEAKHRHCNVHSFKCPWI